MFNIFVVFIMTASQCPFLILARVSSLPMRYDISTPPPGVNALPETATLRGHRTMPFFTPSLPIRSKSASWIFSSVQSSNALENRENFFERFQRIFRVRFHLLMCIKSYIILRESVDKVYHFRYLCEKLCSCLQELCYLVKVNVLSMNGLLDIRYSILSKLLRGVIAFIYLPLIALSLARVKDSRRLRKSVDIEFLNKLFK